MAKLNLSKDGLQQFLLHHAEKVILLLALAAFGAFLWLGFSTPKYDKTDPQKLSGKATSAQSYIRNQTSWTEVADKRIALDDADEDLTNQQKLDASNYPFGIVSGLAQVSRGLRYDPDLAIAVPKQVEADVFSAPVMFDKSELGRDGKSALDKLAVAGANSGEEEEERRRRDDDEPVFGDSIDDLQLLTMTGVQPVVMDFDTDLHVPVHRTIVAVRGLIEHQKLWNDYNAKLENAFGYFPERDRPEYQLVQVQISEAGSDKWSDITDRIELFRSAFAGASPEILDPKNYVAKISGRIPPLPIVDYREYFSHSAVPVRRFAQTKVADDERSEGGDEDEQETSGDFFGDNDDDGGGDSEEHMTIVKAGSDWTAYRNFEEKYEPKSEFKVVRFFDMDSRDPGKTYKYRFRVWLSDPNNESDGGAVGLGNDGGDRGQGERGGRGRNGGGLGGVGGIGGGLGGGIGGRGDGGAPGGDDDRGRGRSGQGDSNDDEDDEPEYVKTEITDSQLDITVRSRLDAERRERESDPQLKKFIELVKDKFDVDLAHSRATDWAEIEVEMPQRSGAEMVAGPVAVKQVRNADGQDVTIGDPEANVLVSDFSSKLGTLVSALRTVRKGDWLAFKSAKPLHVLHVVDSSVRELDEFVFRSKRMVVDMSGGDEINLRSSPVEYSIPGEILVMDLSNGKFEIRNAGEDKRNYLNRLFREDESADYNQRRTRPSDDDDEEDDDRGRGGRGRGGGLGNLGN